MGYRILYGPVNTALVTLDYQSTSTSRDFTDLSPFTNYTFSVSGVNRQGAGAFSAEAIFRTNEDREYTYVVALRGSCNHLLQLLLTFFYFDTPHSGLKVWLFLMQVT